MTIETSASEVARLKAALEQAEAKLQKEFENPEIYAETQEAAIVLHGEFCKSSHEDMCGWFWEFENDGHVWSKRSHERWFKTAQNLKARFPGIPVETIIEIQKVISSIR